jgi:Mg/Co/Ni transporter MgtE
MSADQRLMEEFVTMYPAEAARLLEPSRTEDILDVLSRVGHPAATLVRHLAPARAADCLRVAHADHAAAWLDDVPVDVAASLLRRLPRDAAEAITARLAPVQAHAARRLLAQAPDTAGAVMDPLVQVAPISASVEDVLTLLRLAPAHVYYYVYALDDEHRLAGAVDLAELMQAAGGTPLSAVAHRDVISLFADMPLANVMAHPAWLHLDALPVTDRRGVFLGIIRQRTLRRLEREHGTQHGADHSMATLFSLGELYWLGLTGLLQGLAHADTAHVSGSRRGDRP